MDSNQGLKSFDFLIFDQVSVFTSCTCSLSGSLIKSSTVMLGFFYEMVFSVDGFNPRFEVLRLSDL
ncbi:MAG: hypothetical protein COA38_06355 [Fluviicola sp.]|nr:MAG: hypothetical protein COA38_06355 [Fluviicola sp.]